MKPRPSIIYLLTFALAMAAPEAFSQQYKMRQVTTMSGMKSETTIYVKGSRKRSEGGGFGHTKSLTTIEQCDLRRTIKINDRKKLYFIQPFSNDVIEETDEWKATPVPASQAAGPGKKGGTVYMYYNIIDTGERKKMYGITARHVWTTQKIKPSADACMMKDSMIIKTDGWYIDLPQFNCPSTGIPGAAGGGGWQKPECQDRFVSKRSGKGRLGFPLEETRTMIMGDGSRAASEFKTNLETLEFSMAKLDSMLFEIPPGYSEAKSEEELEDKFDVSEMMKQYKGEGPAEKGSGSGEISKVKRAGFTRIGVYEPGGADELDRAALQKQMVNVLTDGRVEAVAVSSAEEAREYGCDFVLATEIKKIKQGSKVGGFIKAIRNSDPGAASSYHIEAELSLQALADGTQRSRQTVNGKFDGKPGPAAMKALEKGCGDILEEIN